MTYELRRGRGAAKSREDYMARPKSRRRRKNAAARRGCRCASSPSPWPGPRRSCTSRTRRWAGPRATAAWPCCRRSGRCAGYHKTENRRHQQDARERDADGHELEARAPRLRVRARVRHVGPGAPHALGHVLRAVDGDERQRAHDNREQRERLGAKSASACATVSTRDRGCSVEHSTRDNDSSNNEPRRLVRQIDAAEFKVWLIHAQIHAIIARNWPVRVPNHSSKK